MTQFNVKLVFHMLAAFCTVAGPATLALSEAPIEKMPFLIISGLFGAIGATAITGKAYLSKASSEDHTT